MSWVGSATGSAQGSFLGHLVEYICYSNFTIAYLPAGSPGLVVHHRCAAQQIRRSAFGSCAAVRAAGGAGCMAVRGFFENRIQIRFSENGFILRKPRSPNAR